jgi:ribosome-binding protein aMBF1 (putative translation factor)
MKNINFGIRLSESLARKKITQGELARRLETSPSLVSRWRNEEIAPGVKNYKKLAKILNVDMGWLMGGDMPAKSIAKSTNKTITNIEMGEDENMLSAELLEAQRKIINLMEENAILKEKLSGKP